ncbi:MAG TPA: carboxypeptidase regulatory-like domain-containing protein [Gemmatimonadaceae bacterium]
MPLRAQVLRGTVTEATTGQPLLGVLLTVEPAGQPGTPLDDSTVIHALSDGTGQFAIRLPAAGAYILSAKRIGVQRFRTAPITLSQDEAHRVEVTLEAPTGALPTVAVVSTPLCVQRPDQAVRLASLWDEARTALLATELTMEGTSRTATVFRYVRHLEPESLRVLEERRSDFTGRLSRPFVSQPPESLSANGWWRQVAEAFTYNEPDASVLVSDPFLREHCFRVTEGEKDGQTLVGLAFAPAPGRRLPDIRGTIWLDAVSFELRRVEYGYTRLPEGARASGELRFVRLPDGTWIVRRWFLRMPRYARYSTFEDAAFGRPHRTINTLKVQELVEEGGEVFVPGVHLFEQPAAVAGVVEDSMGAPLTGAVVRLAGSPYQRDVDDDGRFRFDSLPAGAYTLTAEHPAYEAFGIPAADQPVETVEGVTHDVTLRASNTMGMMARLCGGDTPAPGRSVLRVLVLHRETGEPLRRTPVHLYWTDPVDGRGPGGMQQVTDGTGHVVFCDLPGETELLLRTLAPDLKQGLVGATCRVGRGEVVAVRVSLYPFPGASAVVPSRESCIRE